MVHPSSPIAHRRQLPGLARRAAALVIAATLLAPLPVAAQDAGSPAALPERVAVACDALFGGAIATPVVAAVEATAVPYDQIPFDLLAIDTLISHHEAIVAVTTVAEAGATRPELIALAGERRAASTADLGELRAWRDAWFPGAAPTPYAYQSALFDQAQFAAGSTAGSGEAPVLDPLVRAHTLCELATVVPFDLAALDLLAGEVRDGATIAVFVPQLAEHPELATATAMTGDAAATTIGQLATWRDAWFGVGVPEITPELPDHAH